jgi:hypothetical protein
MTMPVNQQNILDQYTSIDEKLEAIHLALYGAHVFSQEEMKALINGTRVPYAIKTFKLDNATENELVEVEGDHILAATTGDLTDVTIRLNRKENDAIALKLFNPIASKFYKLYLSHTAQSGKVLYLFIGREAATTAETATLTVSTQERFYTIKSDKDTHFTGALAQYAKEDEDIAGMLTNEGRITGIAIESDQQLHYKLLFWNKDTKANVDLDVDEFCGEVDLDLATYGIQIAGTGQWYMDIRGLHLDYSDADLTKELHISLMNMSVTAKNAGATGEVVAKITYEPRT